MKFRIILCAILSTTFVAACSSDSSSSSGGNSSAGGGGGGGGGGGANSVVTQAYGRLFSTVAVTNGGFAWTGSFPGDLTLIADPMCATEASNRGLTGIFKAVVNIPTLRDLSTNWVLKNSAEYRRPSGTVIGTTNSSGYFTFPLTNSISPAADIVWTGMTSTFASSAPWACDGFSNGFTSQGNVGDLGNTDQTAIAQGMASCSDTLGLLCAEMIPRTTTVPAQQAYRRIFASISALPAALGIINENSITRFDNQCQADANTKGISNGGYTVYKSMIITNTTNPAVTRRNACLTAYCGNGPGEAINWVLEPNVEYRREDGTTVIGTTNANAIFDFPLTNSWTGVSEEYFTGQNTTWATLTNDGTLNCLNYQSNSGGGTTLVGLGDAVDETSISNGTISCNNSRKIICVEQKRTQTVWIDYPGYN